MLVNLAFEVHGKVQGVFFRKYTIAQAKKLSLVGWVRNTGRGTVEGVAQGAEEKTTALKKWLRDEGSPRSVIEDARFTVTPVENLEFTDFEKRPSTVS